MTLLSFAWNGLPRLPPEEDHWQRSHRLVAEWLAARIGRRLSAKMSAARCAASAVPPALWGVTITLGRSHSGFSFGNGSTTNTSSAAPPTWPDRRASIAPFVDELTTADVHDVGSPREQRQLGDTDDVTGLGIERCGDHEIVDDRQQFVES